MAEDKNYKISLVPKLIDNVLDKPSKSIGDTFNDIWYLVLGGSLNNIVEKKKIKYKNDLEKYKREIENEIEKIPMENQIDVDIKIIGQILEDSKFCVENERIRNMFARLVAASINSEKKKYVHPIFSDIIRKMSEVDAKLLFLFSLTSAKNIEISVTIDEMSLSLVVLMELGLITGTNNYDVRNYRFDHFSSFYYRIIEKYRNNIEEKERGGYINSIKSYEISDIEFIYKFLWEEFRVTRLGQYLINTCIY